MCKYTKETGCWDDAGEIRTEGFVTVTSLGEAEEYVKRVQDGGTDHADKDRIQQ